MKFEVGESIGDYQIVGVLGAGGMGRVFRVRNLISDREEAMKVVLPVFEGDVGLSDRFLREIKILASLDHPNIATLHTALRVENHILMFMELIEGEGLDVKLRQGPIEFSAAIAYTSQVLAALSFAHASGIVHRDVKPANVIVTARGAIKLTDFGIALPAGDKRLTGAGMAVGSVDYMSPEQIRAAPMDARSDLYSVGVLLYELVTRRRPFRAEDPYAIMHAHMEEAPVPPAEVVAGLPAALSSVILKALAKSPADRFQTAEEFRTTLESRTDVRPGPESVVLTRPLSTGTGTFDPALLAKLESALLPVLGPIARNLVVKEARRSASYKELCAKLAEQISDSRSREAFIRFCEGSGSVTRQSAVHWDPPVLDAAKKKLAAHLGPIAGVVVERAARRAHTPRELYEALATNIPDEHDRREFLRSVPE